MCGWLLLDGLHQGSGGRAGDGELPDERALALRVREPGLLADRVDPGAVGVVASRVDAPGLGPGQRSDLRDLEQLLAPDRVMDGLHAARGGILLENDVAAADRDGRGSRRADQRPPAALPHAAVPDPGRVRQPRSARRGLEGAELGLDVRGVTALLRGERHRRGVQMVPGALLGLADLLADPFDRQVGQVAEEQRLAGDVGERVQAVQDRALLVVEALLAVPDAGGVPALRDRPGLGADPALGVGHRAHLAPVGAGGDEGVPDGSLGSSQVAGEGERLERESLTGVEVELVELG